MSDESRALKNQRRAMKRQAGANLDESVLLLSKRLVELLRQEPGELSADQLKLLPVLISALKDTKDLLAADVWSERLIDAILSNPKLLQLHSGEVTKRIAAYAASVRKSLTPDRRQAVEKRAQQAWDTGERLPLPGERLPLPGDFSGLRAMGDVRKADGRKAIRRDPPSDPPAAQA